MEISRIEPSRFGELVQLISQILEETEAHNAERFSEEVWRWRYADLPSGETRIYGVFENDRLAGYYHVPIFDGRIGGEAKRFAMVQDVAVHPSLRGQGVFRKLAEFATKDLTQSDIDVIYTFPNERSIHTFLAHNGYVKVGALATYIFPVHSEALVRGRVKLLGLEKLGAQMLDASVGLLAQSVEADHTIVRHETINPPVAAIFENFGAARHFGLIRNTHYLNWRFVEKPGEEHFVFTCGTSTGDPLCAAIFKLDTFLDARALLLMDFAHAAGEEGTLRAMISEIARHGNRHIGEDFDLVFASGLTDFLPSLKRIGFLPVPGRANPRPLNLLARTAADSGARDPGMRLHAAQCWHVTLADWDVF